MSWVAVFLIVLLIVLLIVFAALMSKATVTFEFNEGVFINVKIAGFVVYRFPPNVGDKIKKNLKREKDEQEGKESFFKQLNKERGFFGAISFILHLLKRLLVRFKGLLKHINFDVLLFDLTVSSDDAAKTAIYYGQVCSVVYPLVALIDSGSPIKDKKVNISTDFSCINPELKANIKLHLRVVFLLVAIISFISDIQKINKRKDATK